VCAGKELKEKTKVSYAQINVTRSGPTRAFSFCIYFAFGSTDHKANSMIKTKNLAILWLKKRRRHIKLTFNGDID
jgi:hypothetical protein